MHVLPLQMAVGCNETSWRALTSTPKWAAKSDSWVISDRLTHTATILILRMCKWSRNARLWAAAALVWRWSRCGWMTVGGWEKRGKNYPSRKKEREWIKNRLYSGCNNIFFYSYATFLLVKITSEVSNLFDLSTQKYGIWHEARDAVVLFVCATEHPKLEFQVN